MKLGRQSALGIVIIASMTTTGRAEQRSADEVLAAHGEDPGRLDAEMAWRVVGRLPGIERVIDAHAHPVQRTDGNGFSTDSRPLLEAMAAVRGDGAPLDEAVISVLGSLAHQREVLGPLLSRESTLHGLLWVRPGGGGAVLETIASPLIRGLKVHPVGDRFRVDEPVLERELQLAGRLGKPVQIHTANNDESRPERLVTLASRHPQTEFIAVHTNLESNDAGKINALARFAAHNARQRNISAETSFCNAHVVLEAMQRLGVERVLWGTDASVDGGRHYHASNVRCEFGDDRWESFAHVILRTYLGLRHAERAGRPVGGVPATRALRLWLGGNAARLHGLEARGYRKLRRVSPTLRF
jgi:predicted TIM-barrel fold metal-dependent hydrolase